MAEPIQDKIKRSLQAAKGLYHRLVLLVGETGSGKTAVLRDVAEELGVPVININLELSAQLLELTAKATRPPPIGTSRPVCSNRQFAFGTRQP